jgi:hypothetical protein
MARWSTIPGDFLATVALLGAAAIELAMREHFHQLSVEALRIAGLMGAGLVLAGLSALVRFAVPAHWRDWGRRMVVVAAACVSLYFLVWPDLLAAVGEATPARTFLVYAFGLVGIGALTLLAVLPEVHWNRCRSAVVLACLLFVCSQQLVGQIVARPHVWPPGPRAGATLPGRSAQIYLLLDELNAGSAMPFVDVFRQAGMSVDFKAVLPVAHATAQVVPELFSRQHFGQAKPCGWTTVCSGSVALDFSTITASQADIDVVGFYMPYCAIQGLRYCVRLSPVSVISDMTRWRCGVARRLGLGGNDFKKQCLLTQSDRWSTFVSNFEQAISKAPLWMRGGMMYAHVPLPHPPGPTVGGSLETHYRENVLQAIALVRGIVDRAQQAKFDRLTVVVFSDHPLRPSLWCATPLYAENGCPPSKDLLDDRVPLIVAGDSIPSLERLTNNGEVFSVLGQ